MNTTKHTPRHRSSTNGLEAIDLAVEAAGTAIGLALGLPAPLRSLGDQLIRSASSVAANLAEGSGRTGRDRLHHWRIAYGSALEADVHLRLLLGAGAFDPQRAEETIDGFDRVRAILWRLLHPRR